MAGAFSGMSGAAGAGGAAGGASGGGGLMSMLGGLGGMMGGGGGSSQGLFAGGGDTAKAPDDIHTQKVMGWDVPDLMRNALQMGRNEKPVGFERLLGADSSKISPVKSANTPAPASMGISGGDTDLSKELDLTTALLNKLGNYEPMSGQNQQLPKTNFGLRLLSDEDLKI